MTKRILAILLATMLMVGLFAACSSGNAPAATTAAPAATTAAPAATTAAAAATTAPPLTTKVTSSVTTAPDGSLEMSDIPGMTAPGVLPIVTEPVTVSVGFAPSASCTDFEDNNFTKYVEENSGIDIEFYFFPTGSGEAKQKFQLMVASNQDLPDTWNVGLTAAEKYALGRDGIAANISELMNKYAYFYGTSLDWFDEVSLKNVEIFSRSVDGNMYVFPSGANDPTDNTANGMYINKTWLDNLGLTMPTTTNELRDVLVAFRDNDPNGNGQKDEMPMLFALANMTSYALQPQKLMVGWFGEYWGQYTMDVVNGEVYYPFITDTYKEALTWMRGLVEDELLSPLSFTMTREQYYPLIEVTDSGATPTIGVFCGHPTLVFTSETKDAILDYDFLPTLSAENGKTPYADYSAAFTSFNQMINAKSEHKEVVFRLLDWFCDEKTALSGRYGEYGLHWEYVTDTDIDPASITDDRFYNSIFGYKPYWVDYVNPYASSNNFVWFGGVSYMIPTELFGSQFKIVKEGEVEPEGVKWDRIIFPGGVAERLQHLPDEMIPNLILTEEEDSQLAEIKTSIDEYQKECFTAFLTGAMDIEGGWDNYVSTLKAMGLDTYVSIAQTAWTRMNAN